MNELLALLGRAGLRLLLWPGALTLTLLAFTLVRQHNHSLLAASSAGSFPLALVASAMPLLALALLPLPATVPLDRDIDLTLVLTLLECPQWLRLGVALDHGIQRRRIAVALAGLLNSYPLLVLAGLTMAAASASLNLGALATASGVDAVVGGCAWALALAPLLAPQRQLPSIDRLLEAGASLRRLGHLVLAALLLGPLLPSAFPSALRLLLALVVAVLLVGLGHILRRRLGVRYEPLLAGGLLVWIICQHFA